MEVILGKIRSHNSQSLKCKRTPNGTTNNCLPKSNGKSAARGGLEDVNYPWGNEIDHTKANYNHEGILNVFVSRHSPPLISPFQPGQYEPNLYGLYDMAGNVAEYVVTEHDARGDNGLDRVISRGGDWRHIGFYCQNWHRVFNSHWFVVGVDRV